jgi:hypothetical protein
MTNTYPIRREGLDMERSEDQERDSLIDTASYMPAISIPS